MYLLLQPDTPKRVAMVWVVIRKGEATEEEGAMQKKLRVTSGLQRPRITTTTTNTTTTSSKSIPRARVVDVGV